MKASILALPAYALVFAIVATLTAPRAAEAAPTVVHPAVSAPVTVTDNGTAWTMDNGIVRATIDKHNSRLLSFQYHGVQFVGRAATWEQTPGGQVTPTITIDPATNGGARGEVAVKGVDGHMDLEVRYALERGVSGFYTYAQFTHPAAYPTVGLGESRFVLEMQPTFDWLSVDADRNMLMCSEDDLSQGVVVHAKEQRILSTGLYKNSVEHKYSYCGVMYRLPAYGWSSTKDHIGVWFINPSTEYIGGGAEKLDLVCHMGATLLDYWTSGHYGGGAGCTVPAGESWSKVIGPIFVYCNALTDPKAASPSDRATLAATAGNPTVPPAWHDNATALFQDALAQATPERAKWPYAWVKGMDYPQEEQRGTVTGQLVLRDPQAASAALPHLTVGLAHPDYEGVDSPFLRRSGNGTRVTWPHDGNYYQFWTDGDEKGRFTIPHVRPGTYTLHAFADGVLGEFARTEITVAPGKKLDLGRLVWTPLRYGRQVWEIGTPDRTADEFLKGDGTNYWRWGWPLRYALLFPSDLTYTVGKSDPHKDWFFEEVPHATDLSFVNPEAKDPANQPFGWVKAESLRQYPQTDTRGPWRVYGQGRATTWTIKFTLPRPEHGVATLRVALAGADGGGGLEVGVNGQSVGTIQTVATNALRYNTDRGVWREYTQAFDAARLRPGENTVQLTVPAGDVTTGVVYDYLRLELDENRKAASTPRAASTLASRQRARHKSPPSPNPGGQKIKSFFPLPSPPPTSSRYLRGHSFPCPRRHSDERVTFLARLFEGVEL